jgi:hypothetical protein
MEQQVRIALKSTSCGRREKTNNEEIFCSCTTTVKAAATPEENPKKIPYTRREITNEDLFSYFRFLQNVQVTVPEENRNRVLGVPNQGRNSKNIPVSSKSATQPNATQRRVSS